MRSYLPYLHWAALALSFVWLAYLTLKLRALRSRMDGATSKDRDADLWDRLGRADEDQEGGEGAGASSDDLSGRLDPPVQQHWGERGGGHSHSPHQPQSLADAYRESGASSSRGSKVASADPVADRTPATTPALRPQAIQPDAPPPDPRLITDFNILASEPSAGALESFESRWQPSRYRAINGDLLVPASDGELWFVPHAQPSPYGTILPGAEVVQTWDKFFRSLSGATAKQKLGMTYRLETGPTLAIYEPCLGRLQDNGMRIVQPGRLSGL